MAGAKVGVRDEARQTESSRTADGVRLAKERQAVAVDSLAARQQLVSAPAVAEPLKKEDTSTVTIIRGRNSITTSAAPPPAAAPAPQVQQPRQAPAEARESRSDVAGFSRSGICSFSTSP